ncbi:endonuclease MutS2 [Vulcanimicrobium alpinum]|uniref:Endonuclease MutS2 n=1 Tax=Vulcanimicrobium alpinum TaxID=3016050 RepID=A0AAN1XV64_UNVUL|nr:Smr/MutS family protein [Vulcanimicrobium alpinum]BDE06048.1 endonuclease MutS2 [Vulcanimicrobium alpinum]
MNRLIDERGLEVLDFGRIRERYAGQTHAPRSHARALACVPTADFTQTRTLVGETAEMRLLARERGFGMTRIDDVDEAVATAARGVALAARELRAIADALAAAAAAVRGIREADSEVPRLRHRCAPFRALPQVVDRITDAIDERGSVLDRASPALARIRRGIAQAQDDARDRAAAIVRSARYARAIQDAIVTVRDGRYVVPVKAEFQGEIQGIVHDTSSSGQTLFIEPLETLETNNRMRALQVQEQAEIARILAELSSLVGREAAQIAIDVDVYVDLDLAAARARVADQMDAVAPELVDEPVVQIVDGCHLLLGERAVPQSVDLGEETRMLIVSGPNMGGKTVALKLVGLAVTMTACGMHVPAAAARVGRFIRVCTDIGDEQSIAQNASTFSAHLRRLAEIVDAADDRTLILIDEIGSGTEPNAGAALAVAVLERFLERGARVMATTHATELKLFGAGHPHVANASVRFDPETYEPTYQLDVGSPGQSLAFALARRMRLDRQVVARAEALLGSQERDYERALAEVTEERIRATREREELARERAHLRSLEDNARRRGETLDRERRELAKNADARLAEALRQFTAELEKRAAERGERAGRAPKVTQGQADLLARTLDQMHRDLGLPRHPERVDGHGHAELVEAQRPLTPGDRVHVTSWDQDGTVIEDLGESVLVQVGAMRLTVPKGDLRRKGVAAGREGAALRQAQRDGGRQAQRDTSRDGGGEAALEVVSSAQTEIDVRGKRFVEAEPLVERWIDDAIMLGHSPLRLIHGKGTGLLGRGLQQYLKAHPFVQNVRYGNADEGGGGVTVFELRSPTS